MKTKPAVNSFETKVKRVFDPTNRADLMAYKKFLENGTWGKELCPFVLEWPWLTIPDMIRYKISNQVIAEL